MPQTQHGRNKMTRPVLVLPNGNAFGVLGALENATDVADAVLALCSMAEDLRPTSKTALFLGPSKTCRKRGRRECR